MTININKAPPALSFHSHFFTGLRLPVGAFPPPMEVLVLPAGAGLRLVVVPGLDAGALAPPPPPRRCFPVAAPPVVVAGMLGRSHWVFLLTLSA
mmetsp:Transcript_30047/g.87511  ORF Transcript_30047/g.87511 Transcript_30047/m.87511 type:complete len:94 (-) Transcript_30047:336-617(-)